MKGIIGIVIVFLFLGAPMAKWLWRKTRGNTLYYYTFDFLIMVTMLCIVALYVSGCTKLMVIDPYSVPVQVAKIPPDSNAIAWTMCDTVLDKAVIVFDSSAWGIPDTPFTLIHERRHVVQMAREGGCKKMSRRYAKDADFRLRSEAEAECAEIVARLPWERHYYFSARVELYKKLKGFKHENVVKEFTKACKKQGFS